MITIFIAWALILVLATSWWCSRIGCTNIGGIAIVPIRALVMVQTRSTRNSSLASAWSYVRLMKLETFLARWALACLTNLAKLHRLFARAIETCGRWALLRMITSLSICYSTLCANWRRTILGETFWWTWASWAIR